MFVQKGTTFGHVMCLDFFLVLCLDCFLPETLHASYKGNTEWRSEENIKWISEDGQFWDSWTIWCQCGEDFLKYKTCEFKVYKLLSL